MTYRTILIDPPWPQRQVGRFADPKNTRPDRLPYPTMSLGDIAALAVKPLAAADSHLWLWTTNQFLRPAFDLMAGWGFKYLTTVTWVKPSGLGAWFVSRTQHLLFGYRGRLDLRTRYRPTVLFANPVRHSAKPECSYELIEAVSHGPRVELFARSRRDGWDVIGNEIDGRDVTAALTETAA